MLQELLFKEESWNIRGAALEVHKELGCGFLERVYQEALAKEFGLMNIPYEREKEIHIKYKGMDLAEPYRADFVCYGKIIVELKAVTQLLDVHRAQVYNYMKATGYELAFLINFGEKSLKIERIVRTKNSQ